MSCPIAVMSFNRPDLLAEVLMSLKAQEAPIDHAAIHLFQDGAPAHADGLLQDECVKIFKEIFPEGQTHKADKNLGVALNFERAESLFFSSMKADYAFFFEDDLVLNKNYIQVLEQMTSFALKDERIAYVSAYGNYKAPLEEQKKRARDVIPMGHKWGFALTRRQWLRQKPIIDGYLDIVRQRPYSSRDHKAITKYFNSLGYTSPGTSQDAAKDIASLVLGTIKINTYACFGKNVGAVGLHSNPEFYEREGFGRVEIMDDTPSFEAPSSHFLDYLVREQRRHLRVASPDHFGQLVTKLFGKDPYQGFEPVISEADLQGWGGNHPLLTRFAQENTPSVIIDLGVWKGQSTNTLASAQNHVRRDGIVIAIDTFLGNPQHWDTSRDDAFPLLLMENGMPQFYPIFLSNMVLNGHQKRVLPLAQTAANAAAILKRCGIKAQVVHLDCNTTYEAFSLDANTYWDLLEPNGILIGDNFTWPHIAKAVVHFADHHGADFSIDGTKWWMRKK